MNFKEAFEAALARQRTGDADLRRQTGETARRMQTFYEPAYFGERTVDVGNPFEPQNSAIPVNGPPPTMGGFEYSRPLDNPLPSAPGAPYDPNAIGQWQRALSYSQPPAGPANLANYGVGQLRNYGVGALKPYGEGALQDVGVNRLGGYGYGVLQNRR